MSSITLDRRRPDRTSHPAVVRTESAFGRSPAGPRRLLAPLGVLLALATLVVFVAVGASRMIEVTGAHPHPSTGSAIGASAHRVHTPAGYGASLWPLGFTVHWNDGTEETHLWW